MPALLPSTLMTEGLARGTRVETPRGWCPIEDLRVGDTLVNPEGGTSQIHMILSHPVPCPLAVSWPGPGQLVAGPDQRFRVTALSDNCVLARDLAGQTLVQASPALSTQGPVQVMPVTRPSASPPRGDRDPLTHYTLGLEPPGAPFVAEGVWALSHWSVS